MTRLSLAIIGLAAVCVGFSVPPAALGADAPAATTANPAKDKPAKAKPKPKAPTKAPAKAATSLADQPIYQQLFAELDAGKGAAAHDLAVRTGDPLLIKYDRWYELTRALAPASFTEISDFIRDNPDWPGQTMLRHQAEEALTLEGTDPVIIGWFEDHEPQTREGRIRLADALSADGHDAEAMAWLRRVWIEDPFVPADEKSFLDKYGRAIRAEDDIARLDRLLWRIQTDAARRQMRRVDDAHQAVALARLALQANTGGIDQALAKVPPALQRDPGLLYDRIHWNRLKGYNQQACDLLLNPPAELIRPDLWWNEREIQIRYAIAANDDALAYRLATGHGLTTGSDFVQAEFMTGWIAFRMMHKPDLALTHFAAGFAASKTSSGIARNAYWAGRAAEEIPDPVGATGWYVKAADDLTSFYGQLAAAKLALPEAVRLPPEPVPTAQQIAIFNEREVTKMVHRLVEVGAPDRIDPFLLRMAEIASSPQDAEQVAALARSAGRADLAVNVARRVQRDGILLVDSSYPILPPTIISDQGDAEPALIHALIRQESGFASTAVSKVGAQGLMQLMPATAKGVAAKLNLPFSPVRLLHDQGYNAQIGQAFMGSMLNNFSGSYLLSVAAYNAGPGRVRQWLQDIGDPRDGHMEAVDWIERVPYGETRAYIQRVLEALQIYRIRLNKGNAAMAFGSFAAEPAAGSPWCLIACSASVAAPLPVHVN